MITIGTTATQANQTMFKINVIACMTKRTLGILPWTSLWLSSSSFIRSAILKEIKILPFDRYDITSFTFSRPHLKTDYPNEGQIGMN